MSKLCVYPRPVAFFRVTGFSSDINYDMYHNGVQLNMISGKDNRLNAVDKLEVVVNGSV